MGAPADVWGELIKAAGQDAQHHADRAEEYARQALNSIHSLPEGIAQAHATLALAAEFRALRLLLASGTWRGR